jgi:chromosome segregation ATPase
MTVDQQFNIVNEKLQQLLKQHLRLQKETAELRMELQRCRETDGQRLQRIDELQQQVAILKMAAGEMSEKDKKDFERKINQYIKEIDKCISYLSQ